MQMILVAVFSAVILVLVVIIVLIVFRKRCCDGFKGSKGSQHGKPIIEVNLSISNHAFVMLCSWTLACAILSTYQLLQYIFNFGGVLKVKKGQREVKYVTLGKAS